MVFEENLPGGINVNTYTDINRVWYLDFQKDLEEGILVSL